MERGDLIEIDWVDISEDSTGDPNKATLSKRRSIGYFWSEGEDQGLPVMITTTTIDDEIQAQSGYCIYPKACIVGIKTVKRKRRKKVKSDE